MKQIHGLAAHAAGAQLLAYKYDAGELAENEVEIKISHCGVCHSDVNLINNDWGLSKYPFIPGHEIVGTVTAVGAAVRDRQVGERVGVGWQADSCGICEWCRQGDEHLCAQSQPTCVGRNGGYADAVRVNSRFAIPVLALSTPLKMAGTLGFGRKGDWYGTTDIDPPPGTTASSPWLTF